jgi:hypothetical protein
MIDPRKSHTGKSNIDRSKYSQILKIQEPFDPTYQKDETLPTDSVVSQDLDEDFIKKPERKSYRRRPEINWTEIIWGVIATIFATLILYFAIDLNSEVAILGERSETAKEERKKITDQIEKMDKEIEQINIYFEVLKNK